MTEKYTVGTEGTSIFVSRTSDFFQRNKIKRNGTKYISRAISVAGCIVCRFKYGHIRYPYPDFVVKRGYSFSKNVLIQIIRIHSTRTYFA